MIGDALPLSGDLSDFGPAGRKAAELAIEQIDDAIDETGVEQTVEISHEDAGSGADQASAIAATQQLVDDGASCIAGPWASPDVIEAAQEVTIPAGVPLISPSASSDEITGLDDQGLVMRTARPDSAQGTGLAAYISDELGGAKGETVNIGGRDDLYGSGIADSFTSAWEALGGKVGATELYESGLPDANATAKAIVAGKPDAVVIADFPAGFAKLAPALERTGDYDPAETFVSDGLVDESLGSQVDAKTIEGLRGVGVGTPDDKPATQAYDKAFAEADPAAVERITFDAQNFDAVVLCYLGAVAAGSANGPAIASCDSGPELAARPPLHLAAAAAGDRGAAEGPGDRLPGRLGLDQHRRGRRRDGGRLRHLPVQRRQAGEDRSGLLGAAELSAVQRPGPPRLDQASRLAMTRAAISSHTSVVPAWPPRSGVLIPAAAASSVAS